MLLSNLYGQDVAIDISKDRLINKKYANRIYLHIDSFPKRWNTLTFSSTKQKQLPKRVKNFPFKKNRSIKTPNPYSSDEVDYWFFFILTNSKSETIKKKLVFGSLTDVIEIFETNRDVYHKRGYLYSPQDTETNSAVDIQLKGGETDTFYIKQCQRPFIPNEIFNENDSIKFDFLIMGEGEYNRFVGGKVIKNFPYYIFNAFFLGIVLFIVLFFFLLWYLNRDKSYLYYSGYSFFVFLYFMNTTELLSPHINILFSSLAEWAHYFELLNSVAMYILYTLFVQHFLNTKIKKPTWYKVALYAVRFYLIYIGLSIILFFFIDYRYHFLFSLYLRYISGLIAFFYIYNVIKELSDLQKIILAGTIVLVTFALIAIIPIHYYPFTLPLSDSGISYAQIGVLGDLIIIAAGLIYKSKLEIIQAQSNELKAQRKALKAQINPHFIFNCIVAINSIIQDENESFADKSEKAENYITKFAQLLRGNLENSMEDSIKLSEEIDLTLNYIELQSLRFGDMIKFEYHIDENVTQEFIQIPPMVLQPHIENAIEHGLLLKEESNRQLHFHLNQDDKFTRIIIEDNGVGRAYAKENATRGLGKQKSLGVKITEERLHTFKIAQRIIDKKNQDDEPTGTRIEILIPYSKSKS